MNKKIRALAVVLPQFHPIPENDRWWGKGFTEWTNVTKAKALFKNHNQPRLPADLGYYDLRLPQAREAQAEMAKSHGIYGFCYYHYWFNGKRLLETPIDEILKIGKPEFPFMLCWANENWSRRWDGQEQEVLLRQEYSLEDHKAHAAFLCQKVFKDSRYITINGKPFFAFYNPQIIPNLPEALTIWRKEAKKQGFPELYLAGVCNTKNHEYEQIFDVLLDWQPDWENLKIQPNLLTRLKNKLNLGSTYRVDSYPEVVKRMLKKEPISKKSFPTVMPDWDNSARKKKNAFILEGSTPKEYHKWLSKVCEKFSPFSQEENFVFINAMNEWAEGNYLEPDKKWGKAYLEATKEVLNKYN